jgi:hypothetical protein
MAITGLTWHQSKTLNPIQGDAYYDTNSDDGFVWDGTTWVQFSCGPSLIPTEAQLEKYPTLKQAWEEYLIIKKLIGP